MNSPSHHYEEVQAVPCVSKVTLLAKYPQSHHLDHHLNGKECEDKIIEVLQKEDAYKKIMLMIHIASSIAVVKATRMVAQTIKKNVACKCYKKPDCRLRLTPLHM